MEFNDIISYTSVMFLYVLPSLIALIVMVWLKDWIVRVITRWKRSTLAKYKLMQEDRWFVILEVMKIMMFIILLMPLIAVVSYATNENAEDPGTEIFTQVMPGVFIVITLWYFLAIVIFGIYWRSKQDKEAEKEREDQKRSMGGIRE